jgi:pyrroloquinoline quinone biosynthesis protein D
MSVLPENKLRIAPGYRLQWEEAQQSHVLLYPEGMVTLNGSSAEILKYCDGTRTVEGIIEDLQQQFPEADLADDVREFIAAAYDNGWIRGI